MTDTLNPGQLAAMFAAVDSSWLVREERKMRAEWLAVDDRQSYRRKLTADYLKAREAYEEDRADRRAAARHAMITGYMLRVLIAAGDYATDDDARAAIDLLTFAQAAERFVELWADREDLLWDLDNSAICAVADDVRSWVSQDTDLDQIPMRDLVEPYLKADR